MPLRVSRFRLLTIGALALAATALPVATAGSVPKPKPAPGKLYSFVVERHEPKGFTDHAYTMTLANHTGTQQLGSADIGLPAALAILRDPSDLPLISLDRPGTWTLNGSTLELRNLGVPAGESVTVTIEAQMPCDADALTYFDPVYYMIGLVRYGFLGYSDTSVALSLLALTAAALALFAINFRLFARGYRLRA